MTHHIPEAVIAAINVAANELPEQHRAPAMEFLQSTWLANLATINKRGDFTYHCRFTKYEREESPDVYLVSCIVAVAESRSVVVTKI